MCLNHFFHKMLTSSKSGGILIEYAEIVYPIAHMEFQMTSTIYHTLMVSVPLYIIGFGLVPSPLWY